MNKLPRDSAPVGIIVGFLYLAATLVVGFFAMAFGIGAGMSDAYHPSAVGGLEFFELILCILQPVAFFIGWLGNKISALHGHVTLGGLVVVSCDWSFVVGQLYELIRRKRLDKAGH
jgi:hypothetical protein